MTTADNCFRPQENELKIFISRVEKWIKDTKNKEDKKLLQQALDGLKESGDAYFIPLMSLAQSQFGISSDMHISSIYSSSKTNRVNMEKLRKQLPKIIAEFDKSASEEEKIEDIKTLGQAAITLYGKNKGRDLPKDKNAPREHQDTLYIFPENLQAFDGDKHDIEYEHIEDPIIDVNSTAAKLRTDSNGQRNKNAIGLVVKKDAQKTVGTKVEWIDKKNDIDDILKASFSLDERDKFQSLLNDFVDKIKKSLGIEKEFTYSKNANNYYEVSTYADQDGITGDSSFSAKNAKFKSGTTLFGTDVSDMTVEDVYQKVAKKSGKGKKPSKLSFIKGATAEDSYWEAYLPIWQEWAKQNPEKIEKLRKDAKGKVLTDTFANTAVSQARALSDILNGSVYRTVWMPEAIAMENAGLPIELAQDLKNALESLGIISSIQESALTKGKELEQSQKLYGVVLDNVAKSTKTTTTQSSENKNRIKEASESAQAVRPDDVTIHLKNINIMSKIYPNIAERRSKINTLAELLLYYLDNEITTIQQLLEPYSDEELRETYGHEYIEIKHKINDTTSKHNRLKALLQYPTQDKNESPLQEAVNNLNSLLNNCSCDDLENIPTQLIDKVYNTFYGQYAMPGFIMSDEYDTEIAEGRNPSVKELKQRAKNFIIFASQLNRRDGLKQAMFDAATSIINEKTGIQISFADGGMVKNDKDAVEEQEAQEGSADVKSEVALVQWKIKNPLDTVTARIKDLLRNAYQVYGYDTDANSKKIPHYKRNNLGLRIPIKTEVTFYYLIEAYSEMNSSDDFDRVTEETLARYPWFFEIYNKLNEDSDLRNEFYRCMRNVLTTYAVITEKGRLKILNNGYTVSIFLDNIQKNYNGGMTFTSTSLYDEEGKPNQTNLTTFREAFKRNDKLKQADKKASSRKEKDANAYKYAPLYIITATLSENNHNVEEFLKIIKFLSRDKTFGLENMLKSIGIDTEDFDLTTILPNLTDEQIASINTLDELDIIWPKQNREKVKLILQNFHTVVAGYGTTNTSNLLEDYKTAISKIGKQLVSVAQSVTALQFWDGEHNRNSYTKPDFVSTLFNVIRQRADDKAAQERATLYLKKQYDFDFFEDMPLIQEIINDDGTLREKLTKISLLKSQLNATNSEIGSMDRFDYLKAGLALFDLSVKQNNDLAYYLNPLYSDAEAMDVFVLPRERGNNYKEIIADKLTQVALAEWKRIWAYHVNPNDGVKIDNFNTGKKRAGRFCMIEGLNSKRQYWLDEMDRRRNSEEADGTTYQEDEQWIRDQIRNELLTEYGGGLLDKLFKQLRDSITEEQRAILIQQYKNSSQYGGVVDNNNDNEDDDVEEEEAKKAAEDEEKDKETKTEEETAAEIAEFNDRLERFFYNDFYIQSQLIAMLVGDPAYFKNYRDMVKRSKQQIYSCGEKLYAKNEDGTPLQRRVIYLEDSEVISSTFPNIKALLEGQVEAGLQSQIESFFDAYIDIKETDGQSLVTPKAMEQLFKAMGGRWTTEIAEAFNALYQGKLNLASWQTIVNAVKPLMVTFETKTIFGRKEKVAIQHKDSEYMLTALYGLFNSAYNKSPEYRALQRFMELHNIQSAKFQSCVKVGHHSPLNLNYSRKAWELYKNQAIENCVVTLNLTDEQINKIKTYNDLNNIYKQAIKDGKISYKDYQELFLNVFKYDSTISEEEKLGNVLLDISDDELDNYINNHPQSALASLEKQFRTYGEENAVKTVDMEDIMILQPDADHMTDSQALIGSQERNIMPADLKDYGDGPEGQKYRIKVGKETHLYTKKELVEYNDRLVILTIIDSYEQLLGYFKDPQTLKRHLLEEAKKNPKYGKDVIAALELETIENIFEAPFNSPTLNNKMADLLLSMAKNHIQRQKIKGGHAVLNTAFKTDLHIEYNDDGSVKCIQCYLPAFTRDFVNDYLIEQPDGSWILDFEAIEKAGDEDLLKIIGYRIPTEQKYSCFPLKIVGFNPITAGAEITLPADAVAMSGFDFDIDKLFLMIREYEKSTRSPKLGMEFIDWAIKNKKEIRQDTYKQVVDEVDGHRVERENPFTADEIDNLYDRDVVFAEWYDSKDINVKYKTLKPKIYRDASGRVDLLKTVLLADIKDREQRRKIRNNMYIDLTYSILTSKEGSRLMMQPANYDDVKLAGAIGELENAPEVVNKLFRDYSSIIDEVGFYTFITHFGFYTKNTQDTPLANSEALEEYYEDNKTPDEPCSFFTRAKVMEDLMAGRNLIGHTAVNSSRHYKFQFSEFKKEVNGKEQVFSGVPMSKSASFKLIINGKEFVFDKANPLMDPVTNVLLSYYLSQYQAAAPDNGKDPRLGKMGFTPKTSGVTGYQSSIGMPIPLVSILNNAISIFKQELPAIPNNAEIKSEVLDVELASKAIFKFKANLELTDDEIIALHNVKSFWNNKIVKPAEDYQLSAIFARADSPNGALAVTPVDVITNMLKRQDALEKMKQPDFSFPTMKYLVDMELDTSSAITDNGVDKKALIDLFDTVVLPRLQAFYSCGINDYSKLVENYLPCLSAYFINTLILVKNNATYSFNNKTYINRFINEFVTFALTQCPLFKGNNPIDSIDKRNYYIHDFPMKFKMFLEAKNDDGEYIHKDVRDLTFIKNLRNDEYGIKFPNIGGKMTSETRDYYTEAITKMFNSEDEEVRAMATDLLRYSFYENGIIYGHSNFGTLFPTEVLQEIDQFFDSIRQANELLLNGDYGYLRNYAGQYLLNHSELISFVDLMKNHKGFKFDGKKLIILRTESEKDLQILDPIAKTETCKPLIRTAFIYGNNKYKQRRIFKYIGDNLSGDHEYELVEFNTTDMVYYDADIHYTELSMSSLKKKGVVVNPKYIKAPKPVSINENVTDPDVAHDNGKTTEGKITKETPTAGTIIYNNGTLIMNGNEAVVKQMEPIDDTVGESVVEITDEEKQNQSEVDVEVFDPALLSELTKRSEAADLLDSYDIAWSGLREDTNFEDIEEVDDPNEKVCKPGEY